MNCGSIDNAKINLEQGWLITFEIHTMLSERFFQLKAASIML